MDEKIIIEKALSLKLITKNQVNECRLIQKKENLPILSIFVQQNLLNLTQLRNLSKQMQPKNVPKNFFGKYEILGELGRGGLGVVYKALDLNLNRIVALKLISSFEITQKQKDSFLREASACAQLNHPNIIKVFEIGHTPQIYFTMEYIKGSDLKKIMTKLKPLEIAKIILKCAIALDVVHKKNIIHRDIKPCNIMMTKNGEPKLVDFGLAKSSKNNLSQVGKVSGTPFYMSPEQANAETVGKATDIYSLGATLYECLTKRKVFEEKNYIQLITKICTENPISLRKLNSEIPLDLEVICLKCLEKKPTNRYRSAKLLANDLENFIENRPIKASPPNALSNFGKFIKRNKFLCFTLFIIIIFSLGMLTSYVLALKNYNLQIQREKKKAEVEKEKSIDALKVMSTSLRKFYWSQTLLQENPSLISALTDGLQELNRLDIIDDKDEKLLALYAHILGKNTSTQAEAIKMYDKIIKKNPTKVTAYANRGSVYHTQKKYELALKDYNTALKHSSRAALYQFRADLYADMKQYDLAEKDYIIASSDNPNNAQLHYNIGVFHHLQNHYKKAIKAYKETIKLEPTFSYPHLNLGSIYYELENYRFAINYFERVLQLDPEDKKALLLRGRSYKKLGEYVKAEKDFRAGLRLNPKDDEVLSSLALLYDKRKEYDIAIDYWKKTYAVATKAQKKRILFLIKEIEKKKKH